MKKTVAFVIALTLCLTGFAFGRRNHAAVNYIAEQHLTSKARAAINEILDGRTLTEYGSYPDDMRLEVLIPIDRSLLMTDEAGNPVLKGPDGKPFCYGTDFFTDPEGNVTTTVAHGWYTTPDNTYVEVPYGECVWYTRQYMNALKNWKVMEKQERFIALVFLAHLVGDMHCPSHLHYTDGWDGNDGKYMVEYRGRQARYHSLWDTDMLVDRYVGGPYDFAYCADPIISGSLSRSDARKLLKETQKGSLEDWCAQISSDCRVIYSIKAGDILTSKTVTDFTYLGRDLVMQAGYRLAKILNDTFK